MKDLINKGINIHKLYYPVVLSAYALALFFSDIVRPGVVSAVMVVLTAIFLLIKAAAGSDCGLHNKSKEDSGGGLHKTPACLPTEDIVMSAWLLFNLFSGIWCISFGMPASVYLGELFTTALPMCFYFSARNDSSPGGFYRGFLISVGLIGVLGVILYITAPDFYIDYLRKLELISKADVSTMRVRMHSVIGSTLMGFLPSVGMLISVRCLQDSSTKKGRVLSALSFVLMLFLAFMSNQRSAMTAAILIIIYLNFLVFFVFRLFPKKYFFIEIAALIAAVAGFFAVFNGAFMKIYYRLVSLPGSIAQRSDQWVGAANNMKSIWLGNGLGANGHRAIGITEHLIADGGIAKLYVESGIIGTSIFIFLILLILKKAFKKPGATAPEAGVILITLLMSIGSNMMSFALSVPVFYYCMGSCVRLYLNDKREGEDK